MINLKDEELACDLDYEAEYNKMLEKYKQLYEKHSSLKHKFSALENTCAKLKAQVEIVYLIFGRRG